jgi:hypothetical protein
VSGDTPGVFDVCNSTAQFISACLVWFSCK